MDHVGTPGVDIEIRTQEIVSDDRVRVYRQGMACWHAIPSALACLYHPQLQDKENVARHIASNAETAGKF